METPSIVLPLIPRAEKTAIGQEDDSMSKSSSNAKPDRSPLAGITNDSPIVGLARGRIGRPSPSPAGRPVKTPGSGEALLRRQVNTLLQKVEEDTELVKLPEEEGKAEPQADAVSYRALLLHLLSPGALLAPTPANTPQVGEDPKLAQVAPVSVAPPQKEQLVECQLNRALLFDSPEKSEASESSAVCSAVTYEGSSCTDEVLSSGWSTLANASSNVNGEGEGEGEEKGCWYWEEALEELCEEFGETCVVGEEKKPAVPQFAGKHTRFVYNSDDELEEVQEVEKKDGAAAAAAVGVSPNVLVLKGLPVPEGKHLRFQEDEEEREEA